ncbi:MAG: hypothetical protein RR818_08190, partial [Citrobacter sp.]
CRWWLTVIAASITVAATTIAIATITVSSVVVAPATTTSTTTTRSEAYSTSDRDPTKNPGPYSATFMAAFGRHQRSEIVQMLEVESAISILNPPQCAIAIFQNELVLRITFSSVEIFNGDGFT